MVDNNCKHEDTESILCISETLTTKVSILCFLVIYSSIILIKENFILLLNTHKNLFAKAP